MKKPMKRRKPVRKVARKVARKVTRKPVRKAKRQVRKPRPLTISFPWAKLTKIAKTLELARAEQTAPVAQPAASPELEAKIDTLASAVATAVAQQVRIAAEVTAIAGRPVATFADGAYEPEPIRFITLDSTEPGQLHIRADSIEVISHPVQKAAGEPFILYVTLKSGQKSAMLDTPENRTALGIPPQPHDVGAPRGISRMPKGFKPAKLATPQAAPNAEPQAHDEDDDENE